MELIPANINPIVLFSENGLDPVLNEIKKKADEFLKTASLETASSRKEIASFARTIASSKVFLDDAGKKLVEDWKSKSKLVDAERKRARDFLDSERDRVRKPLTDYEAEQAKIQEARRIEAAFQMDWDEALSLDSLFNREREIRRKEAAFEAARVKKEQEDYKAFLKEEAEQAAKKEAEDKIEIERLKVIKAEADAKAAIEKAERDRIAAEERAKLEKEQAEQARIKALEKAEADKQAAIKQAKEDAEFEAKVKKQADEQEAARLKKIADDKAANKAHQAKINNVILSALVSVCDLPKIDAKAIIEAVVKGKIPGMKIIY